MKIPIFTDEVAQNGGWHGAQLKQAFFARGVEALFVSLQDCVIDLSAEKPRIQMPHFNDPPSAAFVRGIAGGTMQQITTRLNVLHMLKMLGVSVYNEGKAIERTVDKAMTSFLLHNNGINTPKTWVCESRKHAHAIIEAQQKLVIKPLFGSQGQGVRLVEKNVKKNTEKLPLPGDQFVDGVFYLQQFIPATHDFRVFVVNNKAIAAMQRTGDTWLHNVAQGAKCVKIEQADVLDLAIKAAITLDIAYCGVDLIRDENGELAVLEVNSIPAWRGLQSVTETNIAQVLVDDFLSQI